MYISRELKGKCRKDNNILLLPFSDDLPNYSRASSMRFSLKFVNSWNDSLSPQRRGHLSIKTFVPKIFREPTRMLFQLRIFVTFPRTLRDTQSTRVKLDTKLPLRVIMCGKRVDLKRDRRNWRSV